MDILEKIDAYLNEVQKQFYKKGTRVWVSPESGSWIKKMTKATLLDDVDLKYPASNIKVKTDDGKTGEIQVAQIDMPVKK